MAERRIVGINSFISAVVVSHLLGKRKKAGLALAGKSLSSPSLRPKPQVEIKDFEVYQSTFDICTSFPYCSQLVPPNNSNDQAHSPSGSANASQPQPASPRGSQGRESPRSRIEINLNRGASSPRGLSPRGERRAEVTAEPAAQEVEKKQPEPTSVPTALTGSGGQTPPSSPGKSDPTKPLSASQPARGASRQVGFNDY